MGRIVINLHRHITQAIYLALLFFCHLASADWSIAGAQYSCDKESESFTLLPYEDSSEGTPSVKEGFKVLPSGNSNLICQFGKRKLQIEIGVIPPQSRGMCMGRGVVDVSSLVVDKVELLKTSKMFNWACPGVEEVIVKIIVKNKGALVEVERTTLNMDTNETTPISELSDVDKIAANNAKIDHDLAGIDHQEKNLATKLPPENDLTKVFSYAFPTNSKTPLCAHWNSTFINAITTPEKQRHGRIAGIEGDRVYIHKINPQLCQSTDIDCTTKGYLIPGDRVDIGFICGSWTNIQYESRANNKPNISGWIETTRLYDVDPVKSAITPPAINIDNITDPLLKAVHLKDTAKIESLINSGADPDGINKLGLPLFTAIHQKDLNLIKLLLTLGASIHLEPNVNCQNIDKSLDDLEIFNFLIKHGMNVNCQQKNNRATTLMNIADYNRVWAWERIHDDDGSSREKLRDPIILTKRLLVSGADPNIQDSHGKTALFYAIEANNVDIVNLLLDSGANPNISIDGNQNAESLPDQQGSTPLMTALDWYSLTFDTTMIEILLSHGANPNYRNKSAYNKEWDETTSGAVTFSGQTVLTRAAQDGYYRVVKVLLEHGADTKIPRQDGMLPITLAKNNKHLKIADLIENYSNK